MDISTREGRAKAQAAVSEAQRALAGLCSGERPMRMSVPVQPDDPDVQIAAGLATARDALSLLDEREAEIERLRAAVWAADELGVAVQKWTDYRDQYGSGDGVQEVRAKEALASYWRVTGGAPGTRDGTAALRRTP